MIVTKDFLKNQDGLALISIIAVLIILCIFAAMQIPKYLSHDTNNEIIHDVKRNSEAITASKIDNLPDDARNIAGMAALDAATANVQMAYAKFQISNTPGKSVSSEDVVNLLNTNYKVVGDYFVSYSVSGPDKITVTLQAGSKGQFGIPNSKEISLVR